MAGRLASRTAIVTGAASGIGEASAALFASEGAKVLAVDLPGKFKGALAKGVTAFEIDISAADAPDRIISAAVEELGGLDILFNNAGISNNALAKDMTDEAFDRVVEVNLRSVFRLTRAAIPHLVKSAAGRVINTASVMAEGTDYGLAAYCAAKAGVAGITRSFALELGKYGITANYLMPGAIRTGMTGPLWESRPEVADIWAKKSALRRLGEPIDLARAALFLASEDGGFVTGQGLAVDGGLTLRV
ncbi:MAG: SDR family NAD(P)-dependent oxidoreductase [Alphaproteobacteria bacterium]|nr:SDR family NAD(P)-dependent oxidoreductase [Alphaproteobacteria bacterium]